MRSGMVDFGANDSVNEEDEDEEEEEVVDIVTISEHRINKKQREESKKKLYAAWNKVSERALVKVEGKWYDIYDTKLLSPLPTMTKKFTIDFNKNICKQIKAVKPTKMAKKKCSPGLALNLYGSLGGKGYANMKENKEETQNNQILALITPEKAQDNGDYTTEEANMSKKPTTATTKTQQKNSYKTVANQKKS